jgi:hypothetical protein
MKNKILILLLTLVSFVGYSQRVLTDDERQTLSTSETFKQKCQWAVRNYATYWSGHDGSGLTTTAQKMKWAKDRISSVEILKNNTVDQDIAIRFLNASKAKTFSGLSAAPASEASIIAAWVTANTFDEFVSQYFDLIADDIDFTIGN